MGERDELTPGERGMDDGIRASMYAEDDRGLWQWYDPPPRNLACGACPLREHGRLKYAADCDRCAYDCEFTEMLGK